MYDTGVLIAADRNDRRVWAQHRARLEAGQIPVVTSPVVAQASRSPRQVTLRRILRGCDIVPFAPHDAHDVGSLLNDSETTDVVDAHVVIVTSRVGPIVLTSDPEDLRLLAQHVSHVKVRAV
ncbi:MAG: twitching motility protein PilT [Acidimicrobiales bacterium]